MKLPDVRVNVLFVPGATVTVPPEEVGTVTVPPVKFGNVFEIVGIVLFRRG